MQVELVRRPESFDRDCEVSPQRNPGVRQKLPDRVDRLRIAPAGSFFPILTVLSKKPIARVMQVAAARLGQSPCRAHYQAWHQPPSRPS